MSSTAIEITQGIAEWTSRLSLKKTMERFGEVVGCHMGTRGVDLPIVRFQTQASAEAALEAFKGGQVFLDGFQLSGEWKGTTSGQKDNRDDKPMREERRSGDYVGGGAGGGGSRREDPVSLEMTSRDFLASGLDRGGRRRSRERRRSRSRSRRRKRSRSRSRRRRE